MHSVHKHVLVLIEWNLSANLEVLKGCDCKAVGHARYLCVKTWLPVGMYGGCDLSKDRKQGV